MIMMTLFIGCLASTRWMELKGNRTCPNSFQLVGWNFIQLSFHPTTCSHGPSYGCGYLSTSFHPTTTPWVWPCEAEGRRFDSDLRLGPPFSSKLVIYGHLSLGFALRN
jgi:hypothetical protein